MEPDPVLFTCDWCGKDFPADPDCMVESDFSVDWESEEGEAWMGKGSPPPTYETAPPEMLAQMKEEMGLDDAQLRELFVKGGVNTGYSCVCKSCQDEDERELLEGGFD